MLPSLHDALNPVWLDIITISHKMNSLTSILLLLLSATALAHPTQLDRRGCNDSPSTNNAAATTPNTNAATSTTPTTNGTLNTALVPDFGVIANTNPNAQQAGSCDGFSVATQAVVLIPCICPPSRATFLAALERNVAAGSVEGGAGATPVRFNNDAADQSAAANRERGTALVVTLQNLDGPGKGCPGASAPNFALLQTKGEVSSKVFAGGA